MDTTRNLSRGAWSGWAALPIRIVVGGGLMYHGFPKLFSPAEHRSFTAMMASLGLPLPEVWTWIVGSLEFFGGLAVFTGAFVTVAAVLLIIELVIELGAHLVTGELPTPAPGQQSLPGYEDTLLYLSGLLALLIGGAGVLSIDRLRARGFSQSLSSVGRDRLAD